MDAAAHNACSARAACSCSLSSAYSPPPRRHSAALSCAHSNPIAMAKAPDFSKGPGGLVAIIGDEDTVTGFLLAGIGHRDQKNAANFLVVGEQTKHDDIVGAFKAFTLRDDISVILITQTIAADIRYILNAYDKVIPTVLEIPSKDKPYHEEQDPIMQRVLKLMGSRD